MTSHQRPLVLASTSRYRRELLARLGVPFLVQAPDCDESQWRHLAPDAQALALAIRKAEAPARDGAQRPAGALVIGSDQVVDLDGAVLGKPGSAAAACAQLRALAGRTHRLITAVAVHEPQSGRTESATDIHRLTMRPLSEALIQAYIEAEQPLDCAGSYVLERRGVALFARVEADAETADDTAVTGLPLMKLCRLLRLFAFDVLSPD